LTITGSRKTHVITRKSHLFTLSLIVSCTCPGSMSPNLQIELQFYTHNIMPHSCSISCQPLYFILLFQMSGVKKSSRTSHYRYAHSQLMVGAFIQMLLFAPAVRLSSPCPQVNADVLPKNILRSATTATSLHIRCVFQHVRSKTNCVRLPHECLVRKLHPNP
jgi:hypothetical protein